MPSTPVRATETFEAVHTSETDWQDIVRGWMVEEGAPSDEIDGYMQKFIEAVEAAGLARPWLLNTPRGIAFVPPAEFVNFYEDVAATDVLGEIYTERKTHPGRGYDVTHDDARSLSHLISETESHLSLANPATGEVTDAQSRHELIQSGALIVAAIDKIDRASDVRTFAVD